MSSDEDDAEEPSPPKKKAALASSSKSSSGKAIAKPRASLSGKAQAKEEDDFLADSSDDSDAAGLIPKRGQKPKAKKASAKVKPEPKTEEAEPKKYKCVRLFFSAPGDLRASSWAAAQAARLAGPAAPGSKAVPDGDIDALSGLSLVFTGELSAFSRDEAIDIGKRFGGCVIRQQFSLTH